MSQQQQLNDTLAQFVIAAIPIITALITYISYVVSKWVKAKTEQVKTSIGSDNWNLAVSYGRLAVKTAEQLGITKQIEDTGEAKKAYVEDAINQFLDQRGLTISATDLEGIIESAVKDGVHQSWDGGIIGVSTAPLLPIAGSPAKAEPIVAPATGVPTVEATSAS